jgi:hypothetical protein
MATGRNFTMSWINSGHHNLPTYEMSLKLDNVEFVRYCGKIDMLVENDITNWLLTSKNFYPSPFSKWPPQYRTNSTLSDFNDISYVVKSSCPEMIPDINTKGCFFHIPPSIWRKAQVTGLQIPYRDDVKTLKWALTDMLCSVAGTTTLDREWIFGWACCVIFLSLLCHPSMLLVMCGPSVP